MRTGHGSADRGGSRPIREEERIAPLDVVRGFAILGILPVNVLVFKASLGAPFAGGGFDGPLDRTARFAILFLFQQKFYSIFAFLFGLGLAIQQERAEARGASAIGLWRRRLTVLAGIGAFHAFAIWWGDILLTYALIGFVLPLFVRLRVASLARWAIALGSASWALQVALSAAIGLALGGIPEARESFVEILRPVREDLLDHARRSLEVYGSSDWTAMVAQRVEDVRRLYASSFAAFPYILGLMVGGYACGRAGLHRRLDPTRPALRRALPWLFGVGLAGNAAYAAQFEFGDPMTPSLALAGALAAAWVAVPALAAAYVAAIVLLDGTPRGRAVLAPLAAVGRTALSCYLAQSLIGTTVFYGYGLGLYGRTGPAAAWILVAASWVALPPLAAAWARRFRFGPAEWLWRSLTYGRVQAMRR